MKAKCNQEGKLGCKSWRFAGSSVSEGITCRRPVREVPSQICNIDISAVQAIINDNNHPTPNCTFRSYIPVAIANIERPLSARVTANAPPSEPVSIDIMGDAEVKTSQWRLVEVGRVCLLYTSPSPRDGLLSRMPSSA